MDEMLIVTIYVIIDATLAEMGHCSDCRAQMSDAEVLTVAILAAKYFNNHHERALYALSGMGYLSGHLSISRFNRRVHQLSAWLAQLLSSIAELGRTGQVYIIDSMPLPVCRRCRAGRCRKVQGAGYCAAKKEKIYGYRLHLVCTTDGRPVAFEIWPACFDDRVPVPTLLAELPEGSRMAADKGYVSAPLREQILNVCQVTLIAAHRANMTPNPPDEAAFIRQNRRRIETLNSQLEAMGLQHLHARTVDGFFIKVHATLFAVTASFLN